MAEHGIAPIDMVVVNLYPFEEAVADPECDLATAIENIDIGGPGMLRAAAKNHNDVTVVVNADDYQRVLDEMAENDGTLRQDTRFDLATRAFEHTAATTPPSPITWAAASRTETNRPVSRAPSTASSFEKLQDMRYGEIPTSRPPSTTASGATEASVSTAQQLQGKSCPYNNVADTDAALECVKPFADPACVIVKHANPCGVAIGTDLKQAYDLAFATDPTSAFGGIIAFNRPLDAETATAIVERQFVEVIIAPEITPEAAEAISGKKNVRLLACGAFDSERTPGSDYKRITGGLLVQDRDLGMVDANNLQMVTERSPPG